MRVRWSPSAARELVEILNYIRVRSRRGALRVRDRIVVIERILQRFPLHGPSVSGHPGIRCVATLPHPYLIFYEVERYDIVIRRIRHAARDPRVEL